MKRIIAILLVATIAVVVCVLSLGQRPRPMGLTFVGFTNTSERVEALFWFTNSAAKDFTWSVLKLSRKEPMGWADEPQWTNAGPSIYTPRSASGFPLHGYEDLDLVGLPIWTTSAPVRVVIRCPIRESARRRFGIWMREMKDSFRTGTKVVYSRFRDGEVSGETVVR